MRLILFTTPGVLQEGLHEATRRLGVESAEFVSNWSEVVRATTVQKPDAVILSYSALMAQGVETLQAADATLHALKIPTLVAFDSDRPSLREELERTTRFSFFVVPPIELGKLMQTLERAIASVSARAASPSRTIPTNEPQPPEPFFRQPTPRATPAAGFQVVPSLRAEAPPAEPSGAATAANPAVQESAASEKGAGPTVPMWAPTESDLAPQPEPPAAPQPKPQTVTVRWPNVKEGDLSKVPAPQLLFVLQEAGATGELTLNMGNLTTHVLFERGVPGTPGVPTDVDLRRLLGTFAWGYGTFTFYTRKPGEGTFFPMGHTLALAFQGITERLSINDLTVALGPFLQKHAAVTPRAATLGMSQEIPGWDEFAAGIDGDTRFDQLIGRLGGDFERILQLAYLGWLSAALVFIDSPPTGPVRVDLDIPPLPALASSPPPRESSASAGPQSTGSGDSSSRTTVRTTAVAAPVPSSPPSRPMHAVSPPTNPVVDRALERLNAEWERVTGTDGYTAFDLYPGCGSRMVEERFYEQVRNFHPDRFASMDDSRVQAMAEKLFLHVRGIYNDLTRQERVGEDSSAAVKPVTGVQRRRQRAAAISEVSGRADSGAHPSDSAPQRPTTVTFPPGSQKVMDILESMRTQQAEEAAELEASSGDFARTASDVHRSIRTSALRGMSADQALRNARAAVEQGNYGKALELLDVARGRGATGPVLEGYSLFLSFTQDYTPQDETTEGLTKLIQTVEHPFEKAALLTLIGHTYRIGENSKEAIDAYRRAIREEPHNEAAAIWLRHLRRRSSEEDKKKPFSSSFLNKLFTKPK